MTSIKGDLDYVHEVMGLPEENWFERLEQADWSTLGLAPRADLQETEDVFRKIWATADAIIISKPREFVSMREPGDPSVRAAAPAFRIIGAGALADLIEGHRPVVPVYDSVATDDMTREQAFDAYRKERDVHRGWNDAIRPVRGLLIEFLRERGVFPLEKITPRRISQDDLRREFGLPESDWCLILAGTPDWRAAGIPHVEGLDLALIERTFRAIWALGKGDFPRVFPLDPADPRLPAARDALVAIGAYNFVVFIDRGQCEADMDRARHMPSAIPAEPGRTHEENLRAVLTRVKAAARDFDALQSERVRIGGHLSDYLHACGVFPLNTDWSGPIYDRDTLDAHIARRRAGS